jgi:hypothetical protein
VRAAIELPAPESELQCETLRIEGWALDEAGPIERALVVADADAGAPVALGLPRPDLADAFSELPHAGSGGLRCDLDLRAVGAGPISISLLVRVREGRWHEAASTTINVVPGTDSGGRRSRAAFTIVKDEPVMLPLWLHYYSRYFAPGDLYVLDHGSSDGSTAAVSDRCRIIPVHRDAAFDHRWLRGTVEAFQAFLLRSYETVLFAEVDEFLVADPHHYAGLDDYIEQLERPAARSLGFNVVHQPDEAQLRFDAPILAQRRHWHASLDYCKRLISRVPLRWTEGFHRELNAPDDPPDPHLILVHLHRVDYGWCLARHRASAARRWNEGDIARGDGIQNRIAARDEFEEWFRRGPDLDAPREFIPEHVRATL